MPLHLTTTDPDFESAFAAFLATKREVSEDVDAAVRAIIAQVREHGDEAAHRADAPVRPPRSRRDGHARERRRRSPRPWRRATPRRWPRSSWRARASSRHHRRQLPADDRYTDALGAELGSRWTAIESVGLYVPGGPRQLPELAC